MQLASYPHEGWILTMNLTSIYLLMKVMFCFALFVMLRSIKLQCSSLCNWYCWKAWMSREGCTEVVL